MKSLKIFFLLFAFAVAAQAGITYIDNGEYAIVASATNVSGKVTIPKTYGGLPVKGIEFNAFKGCSAMTSITIPDGVEYIGYSAFEGCSSLTTIDLPKNLDELGASCFVGCTKLASFSGAENSSEFKVVNGVLFSNDGKKLLAYPAAKSGNYTIPSGVVEIAKDAFNGAALTQLTIPASLTKIGSGDDGANYVYPKNHGVFEGCSAVTKITVDSGNTSFVVGAGGALYSQDGTRMLLYPSASTATSFQVGAGVTVIDNGIFASCNNLKEFTVAEGNTAYFAVDGVLYRKRTDSDGGENLVRYPVKKSGSAFEVPATVRGVESGAFKNCTSLTTLTILGGYTNTDHGIFLGCTGITSVTFAGDMIANWQLSELPNLNSVTIKEGVTTVGVSAFANCLGLKEIVMPSGVTQMEDRVFVGCTNLEKVVLSATLTEVESNTFEGCPALKDLTLPANIELNSGFLITLLSQVGSIKLNSHVQNTQVVQLKQGWNLVAPLFPTSEETTKTLSDEYLIYKYDAESRKYQRTDTLNAGDAFWIYAKEAGELVLDKAEE